MIGRSEQANATYVDIDNRAGAVNAVGHLIGLGYKRIATITGRLDMSAGRDRLEGYRRALQNFKLTVDPHLIVEGQFKEGMAYDAMKKLLTRGCDAVFAASDAMAIGAMAAVQDAGLSVPGDIAIVGFDDIPRASMVRPALTTIRQPLTEFGEVATRLLIEQLQDVAQGEKPSPSPRSQRVILPADLIVRDSCGYTARTGSRSH
jgi:LacI family transcriptional regulator